MTHDLFFKLFATISMTLFITWTIFTDPTKNHVGKEWLWPCGKYNLRHLLFKQDGSFKKYTKLALIAFFLYFLIMAWFFG